MTLTESIPLVEGDMDRGDGVLEIEEASGEKIELDISSVGVEVARGGLWVDCDGDGDGVGSAGEEIAMG